MNTKDLSYFKTVYEQKSITGAAKKHFITPQGLSKIIKNLESEFGTILFERNQKGMEPTPSANLLYEKVESIIFQLNDIEKTMRQLGTSEKRLRIGCATGVMDVLPFQMILDFIEKFPEIDVQWNEYTNQDVKDHLEDFSLDYGFLVGDYESDMTMVRRITSRHVLLLVYEGHPFFDLNEVTIPMLRNERIVTMNEQYNMYHDFLKVCMKYDIVPNIVGKTTDNGFLYRLCKQKVGLALETDFSIEDMKLDGVKAIPFKEDLRWNVTCAYRKEKESSFAVQMFEQYVTTYMNKMLIGINE